MAVMKSSIFGRLNRIQQLGMASFVFPGASHTRAAHSIGVMHAVGCLATHLGLEPKECELLRLGGLLHDVGQYPLSHCIEIAYRGIGDIQRTATVFENPEALESVDADLSLLQRVTKMQPSAGQAKDKAIGSRIVSSSSELRSIFLAGGKNDEFVESLAELVAGTQADSLHQQLLNSDYDCDRLDYVRRDGRAAGVDYGYFDFDFLVKNFYPKE